MQGGKPQQLQCKVLLKSVTSFKVGGEGFGNASCQGMRNKNAELKCKVENLNNYKVNNYI